MNEIKEYASMKSLQAFLDNLKAMFSKISHTYTKDEIVDLNISEIVDAVIEQLPNAEGEVFNGEIFNTGFKLSFHCG